MFEVDADHQGQVEAYLGFCIKYWSLVDPSLEACFTNPNMVSFYLSFILARGRKGSYISTICNTFGKVLEYIMDTKVKMWLKC